MVGRPGRMQTAFTSGEHDPLLEERTTLKYFSTGLKYAENIAVAPQGGFRQRDGLRHIGVLANNAEKIIPFDASNGTSFDLVFAGENCQVWSASSAVASFNISGISGLVSDMTYAQRLDTLLLFHENLKSKRLKLGDAGWAVDDLPYEAIPNYDYGANYTNGVAAIWRIEFVGLESGTSIFVLTVSGQETQSITFSDTAATLQDAIRVAIADLPNVSAGFNVVAEFTDKKIVKITFSGAGNEGDGWAVSGRIINKADAAIVSVKERPGVSPGEPLISAGRGWPQCGTFYNQRLLVGGFKSLPNAWMASKSADYFNFDERFTEANGPFLVPMDSAGGERIEAIVPSLNLLIFTSQAEYWIAERAISKTDAPNHVQSSRYGIKRGVPVVDNEGAAIWCHRNGATLGELRYTDVEGNFVATDISLLASHLFTDIADMAVRRSNASMDGNLHAIIRSDGQARLATILREQEVTAFTRMTTDGLFKATCKNGRNDLSFIIQRNGQRYFERFETGLLLDEAQDFQFGSPQNVISGLARFNGRSVWVVGDGNVFGPFSVSGGTIELTMAVTKATVGTWKPPVISTLPPPRDIGPNTILKRKARIHSIHLSLLDTTSVAISVNGNPLQDVDLYRYGLLADVPELSQGVTTTIKIRNLRGYSDAPFVTVSQLRPGRLNVRAITVEAAL
ncbi:hypothetical protein [Pseudochrobactrum asaccharolyticum]|uniref:Uncharacterized protein n=1 Tax=Pseudochrobactrum asaccharolyticum TaxID=354351 RepID=A0A366DYH5_9HYPH|nr:hypothetical protein [Pseudochrobactrum asaccharolyticum]RBO94945.1 hypothetical protein DFR47_104307 [Pseudochrobactrum asaccharolyticum]